MRKEALPSLMWSPTRAAAAVVVEMGMWRKGGCVAMMKNKRDSLHSSVSSEYQIPSPLGSGSVCGGAGGAGGGGGGGSGGSGGGSIDYETPPKPVVRKSSLVGVGIPTNSIKVTDT